MYKQDMLNAIEYYREAVVKSFNLAQIYTGQATSQDMIDLRFLYSTCLANLVSLTEFLCDLGHPFGEEFRIAIDRDFVFDGETDGAQNYSYLRAVRNMVVHRGYDLSSRGRQVEGRLWFILPAVAGSVSGKTLYTSYERLLPVLIEKTLGRLNSIIDLHVQTYLSTLADRSCEEIEAELRLNLATDDLIPAEIKKMLIEYLESEGLPDIGCS